jgi:hypothetical protein
MTTFEAAPKIYDLTWGDDTAWAGMEVRARGASTGAFLEIMKLAGKLAGQGSGLAAMPPPDDMEKIFRILGGRLLSWNITSEGEPVTTDYDGLVSLDFPVVSEIFTRWAEGVAGVDPTSQPASPGGETSEAAPPVLAKSSRSRRSSPKPG